MAKVGIAPQAFIIKKIKQRTFRLRSLRWDDAVTNVKLLI